MTNTKSNPNDRKSKYDLVERTTSFAKEILVFLKTLKQDAISAPLITQIVRSSTSIGANYCEADGAESKKDFQHKIALCKKEAKETKYWIEILSTIYPHEKVRLRYFWKEVHELILIFSKIISNSKEKS